jgi:putative oxidoreductase
MYKTAPWGALLLRQTLAFYWIVHWGFKVIYRGMPATEQFFMKNGLPAWLSWFDISIEAGFVICLVTGIFLWPTALLATPIMIASMIIYSGNGFYFPGGGVEFPLMWLLLQYVSALIGPGRYALETDVFGAFGPTKRGRGSIAADTSP